MKSTSKANATIAASIEAAQNKLYYAVQLCEDSYSELAEELDDIIERLYELAAVAVKKAKTKAKSKAKAKRAA